MTLRAALITYDMVGNLSREAFFAKLRRLVTEAAGQRAQLLIFPELLVQDLVDFSLGEPSIPDQIRRLAELWPEFLARQVALAQEFGVILMAGTFPRVEGNQVRNTGALVFPDGQVVTQDKLHMTPFEKEWGISPGQELAVVDTEFGPWVTLICYDCEIPRLSQLLVSERPQLLLVPSMTEFTSGFHRVRWTAQARAIEHKAYVLVTASTGGPDIWGNFGQSVALGPYDEVLSGLLAQGELNVPGLLIVDLDFARLKSSRESDSVYPARDQELTASPRRVFLKKIPALRT